MNSVRPIAFYLPQFYPTPENDLWWGKGFTEWTNVTKARPLFKQHQQPNLPADLGFYDLRVPEVREEQARLARYAGIEGFCYWHYWFGNGKKILDRPLQEVLQSGKPDFPFCVCWANESWTGVWYGAPRQILIEQTYPGNDDYTLFFENLLPYFRDRRYIRVDEKPLFVVYKPENLPDAAAFVSHFRGLATDAGLPGLHMVSLTKNEAHLAFGFDGFAEKPPGAFIGQHIKGNRIQKNWLYRKTAIHQYLRKGLRVYNYRHFMEVTLHQTIQKAEYPTVLSNWDNTPRSGTKGLVLQGSTPALLKEYLQRVMEQIKHRPKEQQLLFIKSWNEWAEGNHLEPDQHFGMGWLEACRSVFVTETTNKSHVPIAATG